MNSFGVVCALDWEAACLPSGHPAVRVVSCGLGEASAAAAARQLVASGVGVLVSFGSAGGLNPEFRAGDILLPALVRTTDGQVVECDVEIRQALAARLPHGHFAVRADPLLHVDVILGTPADKARVRECRGVEAPGSADMESMAVARVARSAGLPFVAVRAVLDEASQGLPVDLLATVNVRARPIASKLMLALLRRPTLIADLWRLAIGRHRAAASLRVAGLELAGLGGTSR